MPYTPKYCCQCGETIERIDRKPWTSRRFCELCETEFGIYDKLAYAVFGIGLLLGLSGIGFYYLQKSDKPLSVAPNQLVSSLSSAKSETTVQKPAPQNLITNPAQPSAQSNSYVPQIKSQTASDLKVKPVEIPPTAPSEKIYFCGAMTKKGTMCSRRVKGGGRCWQHAGQEAMLPQEKLIASQ